MVDVDFEEQEWQPKQGEVEEVASNPKITEYLLKIGIAKTPKQANYMIGGVVAAVLLIALIVFAVAMNWI